MRHLIIIGTGAFGRVLYGIAQKAVGYGSDWDLKGYVSGGPIPIRDDEKEKLRMPLLGHLDSYEIQPGDVFVCGVGESEFKRRLVTEALSKGAKFISIIHETAIIQEGTQFGESVILCPYTIVNDNAQLGNFVMINSHSEIGHDVIIGDYTCIMGHVGIMGFVCVGENAYIGAGAIVLPHAKVGAGAYVGAGSVVLRRVKNGVKVFGNPAVPITT